MKNTSLIVIGGLNTDLVATGIKQFPAPGQHVFGKELIIGPGGKSRNIAAMAGNLLPKNCVAMIGRTAEDKYGLWRPPLEALQSAGVSTDYIHIVPSEATQKLPGIALIPVNEQGENQIFVLPGVNDDFDNHDIDAARQLFDIVANNNGFLAVTLECPFETAKYAIQKAGQSGIKVVLDPGGVDPAVDIESLLGLGIFLFKPNEHEAKIITGIEVTDFASAQQAAEKLQELGAVNVLITHGKHGAYLFGESGASQLPIPSLMPGPVKDSTGCGDQTMAALCAYLQESYSLEEAARLAVMAGTLQFYKSGIQPITKQEIEARL